MSIPLSVLCDAKAACRTCRSRCETVFRQTLSPAYEVPAGWPDFECPRGLPWIEDRSPSECAEISEICSDCPNGVLREHDAPACRLMGDGCCQGRLASHIRQGGGCPDDPPRFTESDSIRQFKRAAG